MRVTHVCSGSFVVSLLLLAVLFAPQTASAAASDPCLVTADAAGNPILPPIDCAYYPVIKRFHAELTDPETGRLEIGIGSIHYRFRNIVTEEGGTLGGTRETFDSTLKLDAANGDGETVSIEVPARVVTDTSEFKGNQAAGFAQNIQTLDADMRALNVLVHNKPCFEFLEIVGGTDNGFPSPGTITLHPQDDGVWLANSSFDINIRVTYIGSDDGPFAGQSGTFEGTVTVEAAGLP